MTRVIRTTWGDSIMTSKNVKTVKNKDEAEAFILRDEIRMADIGYEFNGMKGFRNSLGWKDYCQYEIEE